MKILITGGSRGIGKAIVEKFLQNNHWVECPSRSVLDLSEKITLVDTKFDIVINNAGINPLKPLVEMFDDQVWKINYLAPLQIIQQCLPHMIEQKYGRIVNIGSILGSFAKRNRSAYSSSKAALHSLSQSLTAEFGKYNILCNTVSPGYIATDLTYQNNSIEEINNIVSTIPTNRLGTPEEIADLVYYLTIQNSFISGQNIIIDGGYSCVI